MSPEKLEGSYYGRLVFSLDVVVGGDKPVDSKINVGEA